MTLVQVDRKADFIFDEASVKRFCRIQNDHNWIISHKKQLRQEHPNKYIAVENETVRFTGNTIEDLLSEIKTHEEQIEDFAIDFIDERPINFLF